MTDLTREQIEKLQAFTEHAQSEPFDSFSPMNHKEINNIARQLLATMTERDSLRAQLAEAQKRVAWMESALELAIGLGVELGMSDIEVDTIRDRAARSAAPTVSEAGGAATPAVPTPQPGEVPASSAPAPTGEESHG